MSELKEMLESINKSTNLKALKGVDLVVHILIQHTIKLEKDVQELQTKMDTLTDNCKT